MADEDATGLWTVRDVANELGMTYDSASKWLRRWKVSVADVRWRTRRGASRPLHLYVPDGVRAARAEQQRRARARATMGRFL